MGTVAEITAGRENGGAGRKRPKGYISSWRPHGPTNELLDQIGAVLKEYADHLPLTVRQIFYRLVGQYGYPKDKKACDRLGEMLVLARRSRRIPFDVIRDDGVVTCSSPWHDGPADFWDETAHRMQAYRRNRQTGQQQYIELWCEAAGMAPQLARVADEYSVPVFSAGGFSSLTAIRLIADRALRRDVPTVMLHVGDFDPSGESIFAAIAEDAALFVEADRVIGTQRLEAVRVALTADQAAAYGLPTAPAKTSDSRSAGWSGGTCQLEALSPDELARIVDAAIDSRFDAARLDAEIAMESSERDQLLRALPPAHEDFS